MSSSAHLDHLLKVGVLYRLGHSVEVPKKFRKEALRDLAWYRAEGRKLLAQRQEGTMAKKKTKDQEPEPGVEPRRVYSRRGVLFAVVDDRVEAGEMSTIEVLSDAIDDALEHGYEDPEAIARWVVTSSFVHEPDKRVRYNSLLRAGDAVGAQLTRKLYNAYNELAEMVAEAETAGDKAAAKAEATGFASAVSIITSPFSCEDGANPHLVDWDAVDHVTGLFEAEQRHVRRERKGRPQ